MLSARSLHVFRPASFLFLLAWLTYSSALAQDVDTTPPQLVNFSFSPASIDVSAGPQTVTATFELSDDLSGVPGVQVNFASPNFQQTRNLSTLALISGDSLNGTYQGTITFPQFSANGVWTVTRIFLRDLAGNSINIGPSVLQARGFPTELNVLSNPADVTGPAVTAISILPPVVDVSTASQAITVRLNVSDDLSGTIFTPSAGDGLFAFFPVEFRSPSGAQSRFTHNRQFTLAAGTPLNGTWETTLAMPQFSEPGTWQIGSLVLRDVAGNQSFFNSANLMALGISSNLTVVSNLSDTAPPQLTELSFLPTVINTSLNSQNVGVTLNITDNLAGAQFSPTTPNLSFFEAGVQFRSPSGQQVNAAAFFTPFNLVAGTPQNGTWQGNVFFPRFSEDGTWRINLLQLKDATRNTVSLDTAALEAMGFPTNLVVLKPSLIGDGTVTDPAAGGTVSDDTFPDRAKVIFPPGVLTQPTSVAIDVFQEPLDIPTPSGFQGPGTHFVNIELTPQPTFPLLAPGLTVILPLPNPRPAGSPLSLYRVDPATGSLVPAVGVSGVPVVGTVGMDGLSATFTGIASLSTIVGLIPDVTPVAIDLMPGGFPNPLNCAAVNGVIPVAILSTAAFNATTVDADTVRFGRTGSEAAEAHKARNGTAMRHVEDVNKDGRPDLVFHFRFGAAGFGCGDISGESFTDLIARLTGKTQNGTAIAGEDMVRLKKN